MSRKKKQRNNHEEYWKERGFDSDKEFLIYQYLCGRLKRQSKINKIDKFKRFCTHKSWKEHIEGIVNSYEEAELSEFYHFIKLRERECDIDISASTSLLLPIVVAIIAGMLTQYVISMSSSFTKYQINSWIGFIGFIIALILVIIFNGIVIIGGLTYIFYNTLGPYIRSKNKASFWADCLEIIEEKYK